MIFCEGGGGTLVFLPALFVRLLWGWQGLVSSSPSSRALHTCSFPSYYPLSIQNHIFAARKAFDAFFARYPYCYGYWKKYADMERRFDFSKETEEVGGRIIWDFFVLCYSSPSKVDYPSG